MCDAEKCTCKEFIEHKYITDRCRECGHQRSVHQGQQASEPSSPSAIRYKTSLRRVSVAITFDKKEEPEDASAFAALPPVIKSLGTSSPLYDALKSTLLSPNKTAQSTSRGAANERSGQQQKRLVESMLLSPRGDGEATKPVASTPAPSIGRPGFPGIRLDLSKIQLPSPGMANGMAAQEEDMSESEIKRQKVRRFDGVCSPITEDVFLGSDTVAKNKELLKSYGITHVLNCAGTVCRNHHPGDFRYLTFYLNDDNFEDIACLFYDAIEFVEEAIANRGKVFIHCHQGVSRSASITIGYVMYKRGWGFQEAHRFVKEARAIASPNTGFLAQLMEWHKRLTNANGVNDSAVRMYRIVPHHAEAPQTYVAHLVMEGPGWQCLDARGCFLVQTPTKMFLWIGSRCTSPDLAEYARKKLIERIRRFEKMERAAAFVEELKQGEETDEFWSVLGGRPAEGGAAIGTISKLDKEYNLLSPRYRTQRSPRMVMPRSPRGSPRRSSSTGVFSVP